MTLAGSSGKTYPEEDHNYIIYYKTLNSLPWRCWLTQALTETVSIALFSSRLWLLWCSASAFSFALHMHGPVFTIICLKIVIIKVAFIGILHLNLFEQQKGKNSQNLSSKFWFIFTQIKSKKKQKKNKQLWFA